MRRWIHLLVLVFALVTLPAGVAAQGTDGEADGFMFRANGDVTVAPRDVMGGVIVANGDAVIDGVITDTLWVISGDATVNGSVGGDVMLIDGTLTLAQGSTVENVMLVRGTLDRAEGATVTGSISERAELISLGWGAAVFSMMMWFGLTLALIAAAMLFVRFGGRQLAATGEVLRNRPGMAALTALALWIGLPIVAVLAYRYPPRGRDRPVPAPGTMAARLPRGQRKGWRHGVAGARDHGRSSASALHGGGPRGGPGSVGRAGSGARSARVLLAALAGSGALIYRLVERPREHRPVAVHRSHPQPAG